MEDYTGKYKPRVSMRMQPRCSLWDHTGTAPPPVLDAPACPARSASSRAGSTVNTALVPLSTSSAAISVSIARMRHSSPRPVKKQSPTDQFGTAVTNTAESFGSPSSSMSKNRNTRRLLSEVDGFERRECEQEETHVDTDAGEGQQHAN